MINHIHTNAQRKLVVVLGMARSGTSATARALPVFGVQLGDNLMKAWPGINDKGFWEDLDVYELNIELMRELQADWQSHGPISLQDISADKLAAFRLRASALLLQRTADGKPFGFKDPRTSRLLGFWRPIFDHLELDHGYVISLRDPLSVARSLAKAWGYGTEKACYLWLEYIVDAMHGSRGARRLVVDFDAIIADPASQLQRIASTLGFPPPDEQSPEYREYADIFLDESLRHARFETADLRLDPAVPQDAIDAYTMLRRVSRDELSIDDPEIVALFDRLRDSLEHMAPALMQMRRQDEAIRSLTQTVAARDAEVARLQQELRAAQDECTQRNSRIAQLAATVAQGEQQTREAVQALQERIRNLDDELRHRDESLSAMRKSTSWQVTAPLRAVGRLLK